MFVLGLGVGRSDGEQSRVKLRVSFWRHIDLSVSPLVRCFDVTTITFWTPTLPLVCWYITRLTQNTICAAVPRTQSSANFTPDHIPQPMNLIAVPTNARVTKTMAK